VAEQLHVLGVDWPDVPAADSGSDGNFHFIAPLEFSLTP
jgi:hypothetical protein